MWIFCFVFSKLFFFFYKTTPTKEFSGQDATRDHATGCKLRRRKKYHRQRKAVVQENYRLWQNWTLWLKVNNNWRCMTSRMSFWSVEISVVRITLLSKGKTYTRTGLADVFCLLDTMFILLLTARMHDVQWSWCQVNPPLFVSSIICLTNPKGARCSEAHAAYVGLVCFFVCVPVAVVISVSVLVYQNTVELRDFFFLSTCPILQISKA